MTNMEQIRATNATQTHLASQSVHGVSQGWTSNRSPSDSPGHLALVQTVACHQQGAGHTSAQKDGNETLLPKLKAIHAFRRE